MSTLAHRFGHVRGGMRRDTIVQPGGGRAQQGAAYEPPRAQPAQSGEVVGDLPLPGGAGGRGARHDSIYDVAGREVRTLVKEFRAAGSYQAVWDRTDNSGAQVKGGIYFYQLRVGTNRFARKVTVVK